MLLANLSKTTVNILMRVGTFWKQMVTLFLGKQNETKQNAFLREKKKKGILVLKKREIMVSLLYFHKLMALNLVACRILNK